MKKNDKLENYNIKVLDNKSKTAKNVEVNAKNFEEARIQALTQGNVLDIKKKRNLFFRLRLKTDQRISLLGDLGTMLKSKVGTTEALSKIEETYTGVIKKVAQLLKRRVEAGDDLPTAMQSLGPSVFPDNIVYFIKAGATSGNTGQALLDATDFEREIETLKKQSNFGLFVAIAIFVLASALVIGAVFIIPPLITNSPMFDNMELDTSGTDVAGLFLGYSMAFFVGLALVFLSLNTYLKFLFPYTVDKVIMKIPFFKDIVLAKNAYVSFYSLSKLLMSGVRVEDSLRITMENSKKGVLKSDFNSAFKAIRNGDVKWPKHITSLRPTDKACLLISTNREHSAEVLDSVSKLYRQRYIDRINVLVPTLQLISAIFLVMAMLVIYKQTMMPILELINNPM
jgi:general secretion pathway protein F